MKDKPRSSRVLIVGLALIALAVGVILWSVLGGGSGRQSAQRGMSSDRSATGAIARSGTPSPIVAPHHTLRLEGEVVDSAERPVGGAAVTLFMTPPRTVTSEDDGSFAFEGVPATTLRVEAHHDADHAEIVVGVREDTEPVILRMRRGNTVGVTVVDAETGQPLVGAHVDSRDVHAVTDDKGVALLRGLPSWFASIHASADGHAAESRYATLADDPDGRFDVTIPLPPAAAISGTAVGPDGGLVPDATVVVMTADQSGGATATTDANGAWQVWCARGEYQISAGSNELAPANTVTIDSDGATAQSGIVLRLDAGTSIRGHVVDADGNGVAAASVTVREGGAHADGVSGDDGAFVITGIPSGSHQAVWATSGDLASDVVTVDGGSDEASNMKLVLADGAIRGTVVDTSGAPVAEAQVRAAGSSPSLVAAVTDESGHFVIGPLAPGDYQMQATLPGVGIEDRDLRDWRAQQVRAHTGDKDVTITMPATGTITGVVTRDGAPVSGYGYAISAFDARLMAGATPTVVRSADGRFTRKHVPVGTWAVAIVGDGFARVAVSNIDVKAGQVTDLGTIQVAGGRTITGRVVDSTGTPVRDAEVEIAPFMVNAMAGRFGGKRIEHPMAQRLEGMYTATSDADGRFVVRDVASSSRPLHAVAHAGEARSDEVEVPDTGDFDVVLQGVGKIVGTVDGAGEFAMIAATHAGNPEGMQAISRGGHFEIDGLVPGHYEVVAMDKDFHQSNVVEVDVDTGATATVALAFARTGITVAVHVGTKHCSVVMLMRTGGTDGGSPLQNIGGMAPCAGSDVQLTQVQPGGYQLCVDGDCRPFTVAESPDQQAVDVSAW